MRPKTPADLARVRRDVPWVDDDDLDELERKSAFAAAALGFVTWGGGRMLARDLKRGLAAVGALFAWVIVSDSLVDPIGPAVWSAVGAVAAWWSHRGVKAVNRYVATREAMKLSGVPAVRQLPAATGSHAELVTKLRKLAALHASRVLDDAELKERKVDLLAEAAPATRAELDELLYALLPLVDEDVLDADDVAFLKQVGGDR